MTAEEKLKELYEQQTLTFSKDGITFMGRGGICISAEHIDLIANLVVERLTGKLDGITKGVALILKGQEHIVRKIYGKAKGKD